MSVVDSLAPAEMARQLGNPEGEVGLAVMEWVYENNRASSARAVAALGLKPNSRVLEIGFGSGRMTPEVVGQASGITYAGLDYSQTMVAEAERINSALISEGRAEFFLGSAEQMPFPNGGFDCVYSIGVAHFWPDPLSALAEVHRVLRRGGASMIGCLHPRTAPAFALPENGFYLRDAAEWEALHWAAGFAAVDVETIETEQVSQAGTLTTRFVFRLAALA